MSEPVTGMPLNPDDVEDFREILDGVGARRPRRCADPREEGNRRP